MASPRFVLAAIFAVASLALVAVTEACSDQGEGEVCNFANGSDDCQRENGLACYDYRQLNNTSSDRCCPLDRAKATHPVCTQPIAIADAQAPADTGPSNPNTTQDAQVVNDGGAADADADAQGQ